MTHFSLSQFKEANCTLVRALGDASSKSVILTTHGQMCPICGNYSGGRCMAYRKLMERAMKDNSIECDNDEGKRKII